MRPPSRRALTACIAVVAAAALLAACARERVVARAPAPDAAPREAVAAEALPDIGAAPPAVAPTGPDRAPRQTATHGDAARADAVAEAPPTAAGPASRSESEAPAGGPEVVAEGADRCPGTAVYRVTVATAWSAETHARDFPPNPHFSPPVVITHKEGAHVWALGEPASPGVQQMAETGGTTLLRREFEAMEAAGTADRMTVGKIMTTPGEQRLDITVSPDFPFMTFVTMVAPSPDWFVGITNVDLCGHDGWIDKIEASLFPMDAGTDSGATFTAEDEATEPHGTVERLSDFAETRDYALLSYGNLTIELVPTTRQ